MAGWRRQNRGRENEFVTEHAAGGPRKGPRDLKNRLFLLVDGYIRDLFATGMVLQRLEYDVYIANSAEDALRIIDAATPALVMTELALPGMSGLELLIRIKQDNKDGAIPVIIHTASADFKREEHCLASGCASFLRKPVEPDALYTAIQRATEAAPRQHIRMRTLLPAMVGGRASSGGPATTEYVSELSESGIFVHTLSPRPVNSVLPVTVMIHTIPLKLKAVVLHSIALRRGLAREPGMGMRFLEPSATDRELIRNFIKGQIIKDIPMQ
jgi:CheY-like chemotaxis protein